MLAIAKWRLVHVIMTAYHVLHTTPTFLHWTHYDSPLQCLTALLNVESVPSDIKLSQVLQSPMTDKGIYACGRGDVREHNIQFGTL